MGLIEKLLGKKRIQDPLSKLDLDEKGLEYEGIKNGVRVWYTPDGDRIGAYYFDAPPDLPSSPW